MEGILLIISSTRMSKLSVDHAIKTCLEEKKPLHVAFILDNELADSIFDKLTMEGYIGDHPGETVSQAVMDEYESRGRELLHEICAQAKQSGLECNVFLRKGNFLEICREILTTEKIQRVVITRRKRSNLSRFIFGSAIDELKEEFDNVRFDVFDES